MTFSFRYRAISLKSGELIHRPIIPLTLEGEEKFDIIGMLDSGSDITIITKEIADVIKPEYTRDNEVSGISGVAVKAKQGKISVRFGKGREFYIFEIPILVPEKEDVPMIIGRLGFFEQFKITFSESEKKIIFKKISPLN
jgi:hypothetical protein